jgi:hypothetical protein
MTFFLAGHHHRGDVLLRVSFSIDVKFTSALIRNSCARFFSTFSVTSNSRMMYAFSRDGAIPGSTFFHKVDRRWRSPIRTGPSLSVRPTHSFTLDWKNKKRDVCFF